MSVRNWNRWRPWLIGAAVLALSALMFDALRAVSLPGGHHFGGDYDRVAALILEQLR